MHYNICMHTLQENKNYKKKCNEKKIRQKKRPPTSHYVSCTLSSYGLGKRIVYNNVYEKRDIDGVSGMQKWHREND